MPYPKRQVDKETVLRLLRDGYNKRQVSDHLKISRVTLWKHMKEWGLIAKHHQGFVDPGAVGLLRSKGYTWAQIGGTLGISQSTVYRLRRRLEEKHGQPIE